jgi:hypothetical protein
MRNVCRPTAGNWSSESETPAVVCGVNKKLKLIFFFFFLNKKEDWIELLIQGLHQLALFIEINSSDTPTIHYECIELFTPRQSV